MVDFDEARAEAVTAGLLLLVLAAFLVVGLSDSVAMMVAGLVLLGSGVYQSQRGWHVAITTWLLGIVLFFGGLGVRLFLVAYLRINWVGISLFLIGAYLIYQMLLGHNDNTRE
jgi:hypothetical protein